jgi:putative hydroxymethylpyrimidine transport system permease protein
MTFFLRTLLLCLFLLLVWESVILLWQLPDYLLPTPWQVCVTLYQQSALIAYQAIPTLIETSLGFLLGIAFGCLAGFMIVFFRPLKRWFLPLLIISQAIPTFAIAPLLVMWLGYGIASKIATTILMIFFPVASAFYDGLRQTQTGFLDLAKTMNAKPFRLLFFVRIPAAMPTLASGIRIAAVAAPIGAIVGEWVGASRGLGYLMLNANARLQIDLMFAALIVIIIMALLLYFSVDKLLRARVWW